MRFDPQWPRLASAYAGAVSVIDPEQPGAEVVPPAEALRRVRPLPDADELAIEGLTVGEWQALMDALAGA
jgi:hypothetical protein